MVESKIISKMGAPSIPRFFAEWVGDHKGSNNKLKADG